MFYVTEMESVHPLLRELFAREPSMRRVKGWCAGLYADDLAELHEVAAQLGLSRAVYREPSHGLPPYYILSRALRKRARALGAGATTPLVLSVLRNRDWRQLPLVDAAEKWAALDDWEREARIIRGGRQEARRREMRDARDAERAMRKKKRLKRV